MLRANPIASRRGTLLSGEGLRALAEEQAALRRVATLVARGMPRAQLFAAVTEEIGRLLAVEVAYLGRYEPDDTLVIVGAWGMAGEHLPVGSRGSVGGRNLVTVVFETARTARIDNFADASGAFGVDARERGVRSAVATPIIVEGRLWGLVVVGARSEHPLPADTEARLASFTELVATAIANAESRAGLARLAEEQAALRRVATLVARGVAPEDVFAAVTEEVGQLLCAEYAGLNRYESDGTTTTIVAIWGRTVDPLPPGGRRQILGGRNISTLVFETGRAARIDGYADSSGPLGLATREYGIGSGVGTPIVVDGRVWGVMSIYSTPERPLPADTEARLASFTELVAAAIANAESRAGLARLTEEQAALRRVATLVARGVAPEEVFAAVTEEVDRLLPVDFAHMGRYEPDGTMTVLATSGSTAEHFPVGRRWSLGGETSPRSCSRPGVPGGSTAIPMRRGRSVTPAASSASAHRPGRRSSSRATFGAS